MAKTHIGEAEWDKSGTLWARGSHNLRPSPSEHVPVSPPPQLSELLTFAPTHHLLVPTPGAVAPRGATATSLPARAASRPLPLAPQPGYTYPAKLFPPCSPLFLFSLAFLPLQSFVYSALCSVWQHRARKNPHNRTRTHVCTHTCSHRHTAGPQLHAKTGVWKSMKEKEEKGKGV